MLTDEAFEGMTDRATRFTEGVRERDRRRACRGRSPSSARASEYRFASPPPRTGSESAAAADPELDDYLHAYLANRGVLITPFHNMALMCPATTDKDVDRHTEAFRAAVGELLS